MQLRGQDTSNLRAGAIIVLLILGAVAIGVGSAGDAVAIDQPKHLVKGAKKKQLSKAVEPGQNPSAAPPAVLGKNLLNKDAPGKPVLGKDGLNKHALSKDALSKNVLHKDAPGKGVLGKDGLNKHALGKDVLSKNALNKNALGKNAPGKQTTLVERHRLRLDHRREILTARLRLPHRPLPGERGFSGVPPAGETRFVATEMVFQVGSNVSRQALDNAMRRLGLSTIASQNIGLTGGTLFHLRLADGRAVADVVRALEAENIGIAQPNYVYQLRQDANLAARGNAGDASQYVVSKMRLGEAHRVATGSNVLVAVIDSAIDIKHPDLAGAVVEQFNAVGRPEKPHVHGTGMVGAIAAHSRLLGVAPNAKILAVHAFSADAKQSPEATTRQIVAGLEWAIANVSGVAALLVERHPSVDAATILEVLTASAKRLGAQGRDDRFGWGLVDPASALAELDARIADSKVASPAKPSAPKPGAVSSR
jgi:hypothetical protein